jgi:hypothetical protein
LLTDTPPGEGGVFYYVLKLKFGIIVEYQTAGSSEKRIIPQGRFKRILQSGGFRK